MRAPIGIRIRRKRLAIGLSQAALARAIGISATYLNLIENNKRAIGGKLLMRIGERLGLDLVELSGLSESRSIQVIGELVADPVLKGIDLDQAAIRDLVARFPEAGLALVRLYRAYMDATASVQTYQHRLRSDPLLSQMLHQVLNRIAGIKSGAEILTGIPDLAVEDQKRFIGTIAKESEDLTHTVRNLVDYFDRTGSRQILVSPLADLDEAIIAQGNYFQPLEELADRLRSEISVGSGWSPATLERVLKRRFRVQCLELPQGADLTGQYRYSAVTEELQFRRSATLSTRIFQMARLYATKAAPDVLDQAVDSLDLTSEEARQLARNALSSYVAGAMMMPYEPFLAQAEEWRYDVDVLAHLYAASFEQVAHRLVTLRRSGAEGVPFGFLRADRAGRLTKRFPLPGLVLPISGYGCGLWPIYQASSASGFVRQVSEFPGGGRFLLIAKAVSKRVSAFHEQPLVFSIMLACDIVHADRTVYGQGLDLSQAPVPVGPSCLLCPRQDCGHR